MPYFYSFILLFFSIYRQTATGPIAHIRFAEHPHSNNALSKLNLTSRLSYYIDRGAVQRLST